MNAIAQMELQRDKLKSVVDNRASALKLSNNREFRKLILDEFCEKECARYAQNSGNPQFDEATRQDCLGMAQAAGHLKRWLSVQVQMGDQAEREIIDLENALEEARLEDENDDDTLDLGGYEEASN